MASVNKVILIGNLGRDPELKYTPSGVAICELSLATTRNWKDQDGNWHDKTEWHRVKIWQKQAERAAELLKKGKQVYIEGRIEYREWEQDGQKRYFTDIVADRFQMLGRKEEGEGVEPSAPESTDASAEGQADDDLKEDDDDLPF